MASRSLIVSTVAAVERTVRLVPFADDVLPVLADAERAVVAALRAQLAALESDGATDDPSPAPPAVPTDVLRSLLDASMYSSPEESRSSLYLALLKELVPDEARILAALSDGSAYPLIDVAEPAIGSMTAFVLTNASTVGRAAGVSLPQHTPLYVSRLVQAGLAATGPEGGTAMSDEYEMLLTDSAVNLAIAKARRGVRSARVMRRTVRISELGRELWDAAK